MGKQLPTLLPFGKGGCFLLGRKSKGNVCESRREALPGAPTGRPGRPAADTAVGFLQVSCWGFSRQLCMFISGDKA